MELRTSEKNNKGKAIPVITAALVVALCCVAVMWRASLYESPPSGTAPTELVQATADTEGTVTLPTDVPDTEPLKDTGQQTPSDPSEVTEPIEVTVPTDDETLPTEVADPSEQMDPSVVTVPSEPTDPSGSLDPSEVTEPSVSTKPTEPTQRPPDIAEKDAISVDKIARFSGRFVEDASDKPIEDAAAILVTNRSDRFLDIGTIGYTIDGEKATFIVTGLPPGSSCWVMEYTGLTLIEGADIQYLGCDTSFREDVKVDAQEVSIRADGEHLFATNETDRTLHSVFIYYKNVHSDGNFLGGITYMVEFGDLEPGQTVDKIGGHFTPDGSQIVRIGWQEAQTDRAS